MMLTLYHPQRLSAQQQWSFLEFAVSHWDKEAAPVQYALFPNVVAVLGRTLENIRVSQLRMTSISLSKASLQKRFNRLKEFDALATRVADSAYPEIRITAFLALAKAYADLNDQLLSLPPPKGLGVEDLATYKSALRKTAEPFVVKRDELAGRSLREASESCADSRLMAEARHFVSVWSPNSIPNSFQNDLEPNAFLKRLISRIQSEAKAQQPLVTAWKAALEERNWPAAGQLLQDAGIAGVEQPIPFQLMKSAALAAIGSRGLATAELESCVGESVKKNQSEVCDLLLDAWTESLSVEKANTLLQKCRQILTKQEPQKVKNAIARLREFALTQAQKSGKRVPASSESKERR